MEMVGYWKGPRHYHIKHPVSGRTSDIIFDAGFQKWDGIDRIVEARKKISETELAGPKPVLTGQPVAQHYSTPKTIHALTVYEQVLKGAIEPSPLPWVPGERRYYQDYPKHPRSLPKE